jgi:hypothetical protein
VLIMAEPRFHLVMVPFLAVFAVQGAGILYGARTTPGTRSKTARWLLVVTVAIIVLLLVNWAYELNVDMEKLRLLFSSGGNLARFTY